MDTLEGSWPTAGQEIRRLREARGWTQTQLANRLRIAAGYLGRIERDEQPPTPSIAERADTLFGTEREQRIQQLALHSSARRPGGLRLRRPAQLPPPLQHFEGREKELSILDVVLDNAGDEIGPRLSVIDGPPGSGKTALAIQFGHLRTGRFPDGQLYVDLHGFDREQPVDPDEVLRGWLLALGVPPVLVGDHELSQTFRSVVAHRRMVVVLDNAASSEQVLPLLPATVNCMVIITSRVRLVGLCRQAGGGRIRLGSFQPSESQALLRRILGDQRVDAESGAAAAIAERCAHLPHAVRAAAAYAEAHPYQALSDLLADLVPGAGALSLLSPPGDPAPLRQSISWSYAALEDRAAQVFRLVGLLPSGVFPTSAAAAVVGESVTTTRGLLTDLATHHLIEEVGRSRWRIPGPMGWYALERASVSETSSRIQRARQQALLWYLHTMAAAARVLAPGHPRPRLPTADDLQSLITLFPERRRALAWAEQWAPAVVDAIASAREHGLPGMAWRLAAASAPYLHLRGRLQLSLTAFTRGLHAAREAQDQHGRAWCHHELGITVARLRRHREALEHFDAAIQLREHGDDAVNLAWSMHARADTYIAVGRSPDARRAYQEVLRLFREHGHDYGSALALAGIASVDRRLGSTEDALREAQQALEISTTVGAADGQSLAHFILAETHDAVGEDAAALQHFDAALELRRALGDTPGEADVLLKRGDLLYATEQLEQAQQDWRQALELFDDHDPQATEAHSRLATVGNHVGWQRSTAPACAGPR